MRLREAKHGQPITFAVLAFEQERHVAEAVRGAFAQTYSPLQILLSDDCSSDRTFAIMQSLAAEYAGPHEVLLVRNPRNLGWAEHLNHVAEQAKGAVIVLAAGDDVSHPRRTERIAAVFASDPRMKAVVSGYDMIDDGGHPLESVSLPRDFDTFTHPDTIAKKGGWVQMGAAWAYHRDCFVSPRPIPPHILCEDRLLPFRAALLGRIGHVREPLLSYRVHDASATAQGSFRSPTYETAHQLALLEDLDRLEAEGTVEAKPYHRIRSGLLGYPDFLRRLARLPRGGKLARLYSALHTFEQVLRRLRFRIARRTTGLGK